MNSTPKVIFIIDVKREINAVMEAFERGIPTVGIVDTNCDPTNISYPIPGNDDSILSIKLIVEKIKCAVEEGLDRREKSDNTTNLATKKEIKTNENKKNINTFKNKNKKNYERK
jgi:small subunit ribosomal protein S2